MVDARLFQALSDPTRLKILLLLSRSTMNVTSIVNEVKAAQPAVSRHLRVLRDASLIKHVRKGKEVEYSLNQPQLRDAKLYIEALAGGSGGVGGGGGSPEIVEVVVSGPRTGARGVTPTSTAQATSAPAPERSPAAKASSAPKRVPAAKASPVQERAPAPNAVSESQAGPAEKRAAAAEPAEGTWTIPKSSSGSGGGRGRRRRSSGPGILGRRGSKPGRARKASRSTAGTSETARPSPGEEPGRSEPAAYTERYVVEREAEEAIDDFLL